MQVNPLSLTTFKNSLLDQLISDNDKYDVTKAIANLDEACNKLESLQSMLKVLSDGDETGKKYSRFHLVCVRSRVIRLYTGNSK